MIANRNAVLAEVIAHIEAMQGYPTFVLPEEIVAELRRVADEAQQGDPSGALIEDYLRFLRGQGPEPDLSDLPPSRRQAITGQFEIVKALADRDPELPPLERDPVAQRLGLHAPHVEAQQGETQDEEVALLRLTVDAVEEGRRELRAENARLRSQLWPLAAMLEGFGNLLATSSRDWGQYAPDAWLYAVILGWDCEETEHDEACTHGAMEEMQERHGWSDEAVAKARRYRAVVRTITPPAAVSQPETVHACPPDGSGLTPCCGRTPFELPRTDRMSSEAPVTCPGTVVPQPGKEPCPACLLPLGSAPVERCIVEGPHEQHVTAQGARWTDDTGNDPGGA